jgi:phosphoribosylaminoimidazole-succinocarboxamide synthase
MDQEDGLMSNAKRGGESDVPVVTKVVLPGVPHFRSGKVREVFDLGEHLLFVATDRISAFDCILPTGIPLKGHVLNQLSAWWFAKLRHIVPNHLVTTSVDDYPSALRAHRDLLAGRSMMVRKTKVIPVECVARGYLIGSGWKEYGATREVSGIRLREGYRQADRLDAPIFTPAHKAETGHDENISFEEVVRREGEPRAARLRDLTLRIYGEAADYARGRGIILADTKFEFGVLGEEILLIDEVLTPDSSRFWPADRYAPGGSPPSFDKQFVRDYLESLDWDKTPPAPALPREIVEKTQAKYLEAFRLLTGKAIEV